MVSIYLLLLFFFMILWSELCFSFANICLDVFSTKKAKEHEVITRDNDDKSAEATPASIILLKAAVAMPPAKMTNNTMKNRAALNILLNSLSPLNSLSMLLGMLLTV